MLPVPPLKNKAFDKKYRFTPLTRKVSPQLEQEVDIPVPLTIQQGRIPGTCKKMIARLPLFHNVPSDDHKTPKTAKHSQTDLATTPINALWTTAYNTTTLKAVIYRSCSQHNCRSSLLDPQFMAEYSTSRQAMKWPSDGRH